MKSANQELADRGIALRRNKQGKLVTIAWSEQNGGGWVECSVAMDMAPVVERAKLELGER